MSLSRSHCLLVLLSATFSITAGCTTEKSSADKGVREAQTSISKDVLILKQYPPLPNPPGHDFYVQLLQTQCGVTWEILPSDYPGRPENIRAEVRAWNQTMETEIRKRFGETIFSDLQQQALSGGANASPSK